MSEPITVEIWSDVVCPWCFIGKRRFELGRRAFEDQGGGPVEVVYRSFELTPDTPVDFDGSITDFFVRLKGVSPQQAQEMFDHVTGLAAEVGLRYDYPAIQHTNTLKAHQVLHLAKRHGRQLELVERLFSAYFEEGRHLGRDGQLAGLAAEVGLDPDEVVVALADGRYLADVQADIAQAQAYGIRGVPFYVVGGKYGVSGAQDPAVFTQVLERYAEEGSAA